MTTNDHNQGDSLDFIAGLLQFYAGDATEEAKGKIIQRMQELSDGKTVSLTTIHHDFSGSDDPDLQRIAHAIEPSLNEGKYVAGFISPVTEVKPYTMEEIRNMKPFILHKTGPDVHSLIDVIFRFNNTSYADLSEADASLLEHYSQMALSFGFYIAKVFSDNNEQKNADYGELSFDDKIAFCQKENPMLYVRSFVKDS